MDFVDATKAYWLNAFKFDGRASRSEFWSGYLPILAVVTILGILQNQANWDIVAAIKDGDPTKIKASVTYLKNLSYFGIGVLLIMLVPTVSGMVRRLHDRGVAGGWAAVGIIPFIGVIWALIVLTQEGTKGPNRFGPDPLHKPIPDLDPDDQASYERIPPKAKKPRSKTSAIPSTPKPTFSKLKSQTSNSAAMGANSIEPADEDALYEQAFKELEGDERVIAAWSRAFAEAAGDEQKAKALYIQSRVVTLKQELLDQFEADRWEAERAAKEGADQETREEAQRLAREEAEEKKAKLIQRGFVPAEAERLTAVDAPEPTKRRAEALLADAEEQERKALEDKWYKALRELPGCTPESAMRIIAKIHRGEPLTFHEASFWERVN